MAINYTALKNEILTDPTARGYATPLAIGDHVSVANVLNAALSSIDVFRDDVQAAEIWEAINGSEFNGLTQLQTSKLQTILSAQAGRGGISLKGANIRTMLSAIFPVGGPTRTAFVALAQRKGSRLEQIQGVGTYATPEDVAIALNS